MSAVTTEDVELENVLQQVFMECDASMSVSTPDSMVSVGEEMPISRIIDYIQDQLPTWSIDNLVELWKCLVAVSTNDRVNFRQFKEATKCWIAKMQQMQSSQDGNNNARERLPLVSDTDSLMKTVDVNGHVMEFELRVKLRELHEENILLRDELERHEGSIDNLKQQCGIAEKQLDRYVQKCHQLEKENDEQKDQLNEAIKKEKAMALALQRFTKEHQNMMKQLEAAEIEVQAIPPLKDKVEKISKEKLDCIKQIAKLQEVFDEREDECKQLKISMTELENTSIDMREMYEYTIRNLREKNRQLLDENTELQSLSAFNGCPSGERFSMSPVSDGCCTHSTPKVEKVPLQDSLYAELKALGFTTECGKNPRIQELEEELDEYDTAISTISEQLEKVIQIFPTIRGSTYDVSQFNPQDTDPRTYNVEALKHKVAFLLNVTTEEITRRKTKDSSTQLRADSVNAIDDLIQFGVRSFRDLPTCTRRYPKAETDLRLITSYSVNNNKDDHDMSLRVIKTYPSIQNRFRIIEPIIEELHDIIESTINTLTSRKGYSSCGNSRYRSIHTLPTSSQSPQSFSLIVGDSGQRMSSYQNPTTNSLDVSLARGDGLVRENFDEKSTPFATALHDQENLARLEGNQSSDMSKVSSTLQMNSKTLIISEEEKTNAKSFQVPEVTSASNPASPRRKISVYCRSFDVVTIQESHEDRQGSNLEVRRSLSNPGDLPALLDQKIDEINADDRNSTFEYPFNHCYRNAKSDSDSSNVSTPQRQFRDSLLDDEPLLEQPVLRKICLAPTRLKFPQEVKSELNRTAEASDCASPIADSTASDISSSLLSPMDSGHEKNEDNDAAIRSSLTFVIDKRETEVKSAILGFNSCSANENSSQGHLISARHLIPYNQTNSARIADSKDPHSQASVQRVSDKSQPRIERSVDSQMSSREDSSAGSDSECEPTAGSIDRCVGEKVANGPDEASSVVSSTSLDGPASTKVVPCKNVVRNDGKTHDKELLTTKQERRQRLLIAERKTLSDGEDSGRSECRCKKNAPLIPEENQCRVFPSLTNIRLQESGIAKLSDTELDSRENLSELELQKRYTAFSLCLCIDRVTLPRRVAMSLRQRDQSERNLSCEVQKMQQDIQELAPLCTDRESVERVERVRQQLDMIVRCAHRVSCVAETLGAVHQESRISRAVLLADRYLQILQSRCEKLIANVAEAKRILTENNIVIEENSGELGDDVPRIRYRSGTSANNRMMMARRRASIAAISRPMGSTQDMTKEAVRQRNSVSGRMTFRRPSLSSESPKWETEKLDRTESSNSIGELRGIFEQTESRRSSREENNNMLRLSNSNSQTVTNYAIVDNEMWMNAKQETSPEFVSANEDANSDGRSCTRSPQSLQLRSAPWRTMLWSIIIFFLGFFVNQVISVVNVCSGPSNNWSFEHILGKYIQTRNAAPHPM